MLMTRRFGNEDRDIAVAAEMLRRKPGTACGLDPAERVAASA